MGIILNFNQHFKFIAKTILLHGIYLFCLSTLYAQDTNFEQTVQLIKKKVSCCSVPFAASTKSKVDSIAIAKNGDITLSYSDKRPNQTFNIFKLYKEEKGATGIDTIMGGKFIQFYVSEEKIRLIRFATPQDAKEVYQAFLQIMKAGKGEKKMFSDLNFSQTVDVINIRLSKWLEMGNHVTLSAFEDGNIIIANKRNQFFRFNLLELIPPHDGKWRGIETIACDPRTHAPIAWINFNTPQATTAFIRLECNTPETELHIIRSAFLHLRSLCKNSNSSYTRPSESMYFVNRNAVINSNNETVVSSIRSKDKKDVRDTTITIDSNGEGWLDKDSLPVGTWNFYSQNHAGEEYLLKSGTYHRTTAPMFEVINIDSSDLAKNYGLSYYSLKQEQLQIIPFIKTNKWNYFHANGRIWKTVNYKSSQVPIVTNTVMNDLADQSSTKLIIVLKEEPDEWIDGELNEYDEKGSLYKKLVYQTSGEVYKKTLYNKNGNIIKTEIARPYQNQVLTTNY